MPLEHCGNLLGMDPLAAVMATSLPCCNPGECTCYLGKQLLVEVVVGRVKLANDEVIFSVNNTFVPMLHELQWLINLEEQFRVWF